MLSDLNQPSGIIDNDARYPHSRRNSDMIYPPVLNVPTRFHVSLDIETLSTAKNAVVLSIGAVMFELRPGGDRSVVGPETFLSTLAVQPQIDKGRGISEGTLKFWAAQGAGLFESALGGVDQPATAITRLGQWLREHQHGDDPLPVWTKGPAFDGAIIEDLCADFGMTCPVRYRDWRDVRTIESVAGYKAPEIGALAHDPVVDATAQAKSVIECYERLGLFR